MKNTEYSVFFHTLLSMERCEKCNTKSCDFSEIMNLATSYFEKEFQWDLKLNICSKCSVWLGTKVTQSSDLSKPPTRKIMPSKAFVPLAPCERVYWKEQMEEDRERWIASQKHKKVPKLKILPRPSREECLKLERERVAKGAIPCDDTPKAVTMDPVPPEYTKQLLEDVQLIQERLRIKQAAEKQQTEEAKRLKRDRAEQKFIKKSFPAHYIPYIWPFHPETPFAQDSLKQDPDYFLKLMKQASHKRWNRLELEFMIERINTPSDECFQASIFNVIEYHSPPPASKPIPIPQPEPLQLNEHDFSPRRNNSPQQSIHESPPPSHLYQFQCSPTECRRISLVEPTLGRGTNQCGTLEGAESQNQISVIQPTLRLCETEPWFEESEPSEWKQSSLGDSSNLGGIDHGQFEKRQTL